MIDITSGIKPMPCVKLAETIPEQAMHLAEEVGEACKELKLAHTTRAAEELMDVIVTANTMLNNLGFDEADISALCERVNAKNKARGYW